MNRHISMYLAISMMLLFGLMGLLLGFFISPEYQFSMNNNLVMDLGAPDRLLDKRYLNAMIAHHREAMLLAQQAGKSSQRQEIQQLANKILSEEPKLIEELYAWKHQWFNDRRKVNDPKVTNLGGYNTTFDLRLLNTLIAHHQEGIDMVGEVKLKTSRSEVIDNADAIVLSLEASLVQLQKWREEWYGIK